METIKEVLIKRDNMSACEAENLIDEAKDQFHRYLEEGDECSAEDICAEFFGLEPDYIDELISI